MGNTFEVYEWIFVDRPLQSSYEYQIKYSGESFFKAIYTVIKLKVFGKSACLKLEWR